MSVGGTPKQTAKVAGNHKRQDTFAGNCQGGQSTIARCAKAKFGSISRLSNPARNYSNFWGVLSNQGPSTTHSGRGKSHKILGAHFFQAKEKLRQGPIDHRSSRFKQMPPHPNTPSPNMETSRRNDPRPLPEMGSDPGPPGLLPPFGLASEHQKMDESVVQGPRLAVGGHAIWVVDETILGPSIGPTN